LRIDFIVSASKRDAENVPRLPESSPQNDSQCARRCRITQPGVQLCESGQRRSTCDRLPGRCRGCLFLKQPEPSHLARPLEPSHTLGWSTTLRSNPLHREIVEISARNPSRGQIGAIACERTQVRTNRHREHREPTLHRLFLAMTSTPLLGP
jgi:hypothetical protein